MEITVTGATGFIGRALCKKLLKEGHTLTALSRDSARAIRTLGPGIRCLTWGSGDREWQAAVQGSEAVIHLAGESVAGERWTPEFKDRIQHSRVEVTRRLTTAILGGGRPGPALISASAVGYYGGRGEVLLTEESGPGKGFLPEVCVAWEREALRATEVGARVVMVRLGVVLGDGGALEKLLKPLPIPLSPWKLGLGGCLGSGRQWFPWIHLQDVVGLFLFALEHPELSGPINAVAPNPARNSELTQIIGKIMHRPVILPVPAFALRGLLGEFAETLLESQHVSPAKAKELGYSFQFPTLEPALRDLLKLE